MVHAQDGPVKVTVRVTDGGFDPSVIEVAQGKSVELTFVFAHVAYPQEEHIIVIPGYKIETAKIDAAHRETTVTFIAAQTGTFSFQCDLECDTHDSLQNGQIKVTPSAGGAAVVLLPSKLVVDPVSGVLIEGGSVSIAATLQGEDGKPIPRAEVRFYARQEFLGQAGLVEIGVVKTLPNGYASVLYHPTTRDPRTIVAKFSGVGTYAATEKEISLIGSDQFVPRGVPATDDSLHGLKGAAHVALVVVIACVWLAFAFLGLQALGIERAGRGGGPE
jgi:plastocyanin